MVFIQTDHKRETGKLSVLLWLNLRNLAGNDAILKKKRRV